MQLEQDSGLLKVRGFGYRNTQLEADSGHTRGRGWASPVAVQSSDLVAALLMASQLPSRPGYQRAIVDVIAQRGNKEWERLGSVLELQVEVEGLGSLESFA